MALRGSRRFMSKDSIQSGMLLDITYQKTPEEAKNYSLLVIDPNKENKFSKALQMHALLVDDLEDGEVVRMVNDMAQFAPDPADKRAPVADLKNDAAYQGFIDNYDTKKRYRTFTLTKIKNVRQILIGEIANEQ